MLVSSAALAQYTIPISFWLSPQFTAPTAMSGSDDLQINSHYQKQALGGNIDGRSMIISGQFPLYGKRGARYGQLGISGIRQEHGASYLFSTTGAMLSYNYTVNLSEQHHLVAGVQGAYSSRRIDWRKVTTSNQFSDGQIKPELPHGETYLDYKSAAFTTNVGLGYFVTDRRGEQTFHLGAGMINANKGRFTYLENDQNQAEPVRWVVYSKVRLIRNVSYELVSNMYWQRERAFGDFVGGLQLNKGINPRKSVIDEHLGIGLYYSPDHTGTVAMQLAKQNWLMGVSYSMPFGNKNLQNIQNAAEVTIGWRMPHAGKKRSYYNSRNWGRKPLYQSKSIFSGQAKKRSPAYKYRSNKRRTATYSNGKFSRKMSSYKKNAKGRKPKYIYKAKKKSAFSKKKKVYKSKKAKKWKPKKRTYRKVIRRMGKN